MFDALFYTACVCAWAGEIVTLAGWIKFSATRKASNERPRFSVVVCFHNEIKVVERCLTALAALDYPDFEYVLVDDRSTDGTTERLKAWVQNRSNAKYVRVESVEFSPKKQALLAGARAADGEWLALTDADCAPPPHWLHALARAVRRGKPVVVGYSPYLVKPGLLGFFIRHETEKTALEYLGRAALGWNYMAVGRNMAVKRQTLLDDGFRGHRNRLSGSDDLLVRRHAAAPCVEAQAPTLPPQNLMQWWNQKTRHVSASSGYSLATQTALFVFHAGRFALWFSALAYGRWEGLVVFWTLQTLLYFVAKKFLSLHPNILFLAFFDSLLIIYQMTVVPAGRLRRPIWKKI